MVKRAFDKCVMIVRFYLRKNFKDILKGKRIEPLLTLLFFIFLSKKREIKF